MEKQYGTFIFTFRLKCTITMMLIIKNYSNVASHKHTEFSTRLFSFYSNEGAFYISGLISIVIPAHGSQVFHSKELTVQMDD